MALEKLKKMVKDNKVEFIDLKVCNLLGAWHHITVPASALKPELFKHGVGVDGSSMAGFSKIENGDMVVIPDTATAVMDPFFERPTLSMICDIMESTGV